MTSAEKMKDEWLRSEDENENMTSDGKMKMKCPNENPIKSSRAEKRTEAHRHHHIHNHRVLANYGISFLHRSHGLHLRVHVIRHHAHPTIKAPTALHRR